MRNIKQSTWEIWMSISTIWLFSTILCGIIGAEGLFMWINTALCIGNLLLCLYIGARTDLFDVDHSDYMYIVGDEEDDCCNRD